MTFYVGVPLFHTHETVKCRYYLVSHQKKIETLLKEQGNILVINGIPLENKLTTLISVS